jgi:type III restriction enzyme
MKELDYQHKAVKKIVSNALEFISEKGSFVMVFHAPTGSGKTVMMADALTKIVKDDDRKQPLSFIWISVNTLHEQSKESLDAYFSGERLLTCVGVTDLNNKQIHENEILFVNWESLNKEKNLFIRDNERDENLSKVVENTKEEGREVVLIIDESHRGAKTVKSSELIEVIGPKLTIEVSATPKDTTSDIRVKVDIGEVISEEMIKEEILINLGLENVETNEDVIEAAIKKRNALAKAYKDEDSTINPLLLIQIPNKSSGSVRNPEDMVIDILRQKGITVENGKLAIWLSETSRELNKDELRQNGSSVDILIFKQAIALGWDCPRASILMLQREWNSNNYEFNIQTLGRIMRMPEQHYYSNHPELNKGYIYTASKSFTIVEDLADDYVSRVQMLRDETRYSNISLPSQYIRRKREKTRLSGNFRSCLLESASDFGISDKVNISSASLKKNIGVGGEVSSLDREQNIDFQSHKEILRGREEITVAYTKFIGSQTAPYSRARSTEIIKSSMRSMFKQTFNIDNEDDIANIIMNPVNQAHISDLVALAKKKYTELPEVEDIVNLVENWQVPNMISVFDPFKEMPEIHKSIMAPYCIKVDKNEKHKLSGPELKFITDLEATDDDLRWWFKNGERESKFFGIAYQREDGRKYAFYPDFILRTKKELIIVEIKDDSDFKNENILKLNAGRKYRDDYIGSEALSFYIISPLDYGQFFRRLRDQDLGSFRPQYEDNLEKVTASRRKIAEETGASNKEDQELLEEYDRELTRALQDKEMTEMSLEEAKATITNMKQALSFVPATDTEKKRVKLPKPFNLCVLGDVADEAKLRSGLRGYFEKYGLRATDWNIDILNNSKLKTTDVLGALKSGQSKYNLIVTGQIYHHAGKGNQSANLLTDHIIGSSPRDMLTTSGLADTLDDYILETF